MLKYSVMELLYITNSKGKRLSVILPIDYYNSLVKRVKKLEEMQNKEALKKTKKTSKK